MALVINTNIPSLTAQRNLTANQQTLMTSLERLSSSVRINSAKDDSAGLAISTRFGAQVRGLNQAARNAVDGMSLTQTAEGALESIGRNLQRIRELAVDAANASKSTSDRVALQKDVSALQSDIALIIRSTDFNGIKLLNASSNLHIQVGAYGKAGGRADGIQTIRIGVRNLASANGTTGIGSALNDLTLTGANTAVKVGDAGRAMTRSAQQAMAISAVTVLDRAIDIVSAVRADFGTAANRFESAWRNAQSMSSATEISKGTLEGTDYAAEMATLTRNLIMRQAGIAMLTQANVMPQRALSLLQ